MLVLELAESVDKLEPFRSFWDWFPHCRQVERVLLMFTVQIFDCSFLLVVSFEGVRSAGIPHSVSHHKFGGEIQKASVIPT